jgi:V/A-type H+-transporting ATPase subunit D
VKVRHPPGRAGRPWLAHRLAVAQRGAELLDEKQRALARERRRLEPEVASARADWEACARAAERWMMRAATLGGERQVALARSVPAAADLTVRWHNIIGVTCPVEAVVAPPALPERELSASGGSAALLEATAAHRRALAAATRLAVADGALRRIEVELRATALRRNAIERRWIPAHADALAALELTLEELEREDGARVRRVAAGPGA